MVKPLVVYGDATATVIGILDDALTGRVEAYVTGYAIGSRVPRDRSTDVPHLPFVLVAHDGTPSLQHPVNARATMRVTVWHESAEQAHDLAQLCHGLLLAYMGGDTIRSIRPSFGVLPALDSGSNTPLATFSVLANMRALPL